MIRKTRNNCKKSLKINQKNNTNVPSQSVNGSTIVSEAMKYIGTTMLGRNDTEQFGVLVLLNMCLQSKFHYLVDL